MKKKILNYLSDDHHDSLTELLSLSSISFRPQSGYSIMFLSMLSVLSSNTSNERISRITISQKGTNGEKDFRDSQSRTPVVLQDVQTNDSLTVYVTVINSSSKSNLREENKVLRILF